jgi:hypothetical protein
MSLTITTSAMTGAHTAHTARALDGGGWEVSWLPGRTLTQNQAVTAMTIAEVASGGLTGNRDRLRPHLHNWASELGLTGPDVLNRVSGPPALHAQETK